MSPQPGLVPTPSPTPISEICQRFESMKRRALETNDHYFCDLPALECEKCGKCISFGGCDNFAAQQFTIEHVCHCRSV